MAIDTSVPKSPGWWMQHLFNQLQGDQKRLQVIEDYYTGRPPLPWGSEDTRSRFFRFQVTSRSNFAALIVQAPSERCGVRAIATGADHDDDGDQEAWRLFQANDLGVHFTDVVRMAWKWGRSYMAIGMDDDGPVITAEDPRQVTIATDPLRPRKTVAAFKLYHDDQLALDVAILWLPGQKFVATRERKVTARRLRVAGAALTPTEPTPVSFSAAGFDLRPFAGTPEAVDVVDGIFSESYDVLDVPVVPYYNREGVGEFELHTDLLDRINHMILQRIVIATLQAFRQRAIEIQNSDDLPEFDDDGKKIDYDDIFAADPGALWKLPAGAKIWESGQVDLTGILQAVKDDVLHLAAVTRTPMSMFTPDAATQTAEGASLQREGLTNKVDEFLRGADRSLARVMSIAFKFKGDDVRSDLSQIAIDWMPTERYSLAEQGSAAAQSVGSLTWEQQQRIIWQQSPAQIAIAKQQRAQDALLAQLAAPVPSQVQRPAAAQQGAPVGQPAGAVNA